MQVLGPEQVLALRRVLLRLELVQQQELQARRQAWLRPGLLLELQALVPGSRMPDRQRSREPG